MRALAAILLGTLVGIFLLERDWNQNPLGDVIRQTPSAPEPQSEPPDPLPRTTTPHAPANAGEAASSKFLARLEWGDTLWRFRAMGDALVQQEVRAQLQHGASRILECDGILPGNAWLDLEFLVRPRRDTVALRLVNRTEGTPAERMSLRVWTMGEDYPVRLIRRLEELLDQLEAFAGVKLVGGVDLLVTPEMGRELFPATAQWPAWAAGLYLPADEFCLAKSRLGEGYGELVARHEVVHAFLFRFTKEFSEHRFLHEGLAEYLRRLQPGDAGLKIPVDRFAHELAALDARITALERGAYDFDGTLMRRLLTMDAKRFYALRELTYGLAQAVMVYVDHRAIEKSLRDRSDRALCDAVGALDWRRFRAFLGTAARKGRAQRAMAIDEGERHMATGDRESVLEELGVRTEEGAKDFETIAWDEVRSLRRREEIVDEIFHPDFDVVVAGDLSDAADQVLSEPIRIDRVFVDIVLAREAITLRGILDALSVPYIRPHFIGLAADWTPSLDHRIRLPYDSRGLPERMAASGNQETPLILCCATREELSPEESAARIAAYREEIERHSIHPAAVLVLDFVEGGGDGLLIAKAFASRHFGTGVAYWQPATPLPR